MSAVFLHIPRTGGSTLWHSLIHAVDNNHPLIFDLYHHSRITFGSPYKALNAIYDIQNNIDNIVTKSIFHHHTRQNISCVLSPNIYAYCSIVRDPVERFVSEIFHLKNLIQTNTFDEYEFEYHKNLLGNELIVKMSDDSISPDNLLFSAMEVEFFQNYYINTFWQLLFGDPEQADPIYLADAELVLPMLAFAVNKSFAFIGRYPDFQHSIQSIARLSGICYDHDSGFVVVANGSRKLPIQPQTLERLREMNQADYRFLDLIADPHRVADQAALIARLADIEAERSALHAHLATSQALATELVERLRISQTEGTALAERLGATEAESAGLHERLSASQAEGMELAKRLSAAEAALAAIYTSRSWRFTAPFRMGARVQTYSQ